MTNGSSWPEAQLQAGFQTAPAGKPDEEDRHRLTTLSGLTALSLDALSSVAYGPEAIVVVLVAAGTAWLTRFR
jgi:hypothetical protein